MSQKYPIETRWFRQQLKAMNKTAEGLGLFMAVHKSAVSKMLNGQRDMTANEQDQVAEYLGVGIAEIAAHRGRTQPGFGENKQDSYLIEANRETLAGPKMFTEDDIIMMDGQRMMKGPNGLITVPAIFGCMKGTITVMPEVDLTAPMDWDEEWGEKIYNE